MNNKYVHNKRAYVALVIAHVGGNNNEVYSDFWENIKNDVEFLCDMDSIILNEINDDDKFTINNLIKVSGGHSGDLLLSGIIKKNMYEHDVVIKFCYPRAPSKISRYNADIDIYHAKKHNNEIGITHYISSFFLDNPRVTDNYTLFYVGVGCKDFFDKNKHFQRAFEFQYEKIERPSTKNVGIMIVEKALYDLRHVIYKYRELQFGEIIVSIIIQITYTLMAFDKYLGGFFHADLHAGNILLTPESRDRKKILLRLRGTEYKLNLKTHGYCPKLWDFGRSFVGNLLNEKSIKNAKNTFFDYLHPDGDTREQPALIPTLNGHHKRKLPVWIKSTILDDMKSFVSKMGDTFAKMGEKSDNPNFVTEYRSPDELNHLPERVIYERRYRFVKRGDKYTEFINGLTINFPNSMEDLLQMSINVLNEDEKEGNFSSSDYDLVCDFDN